MRRRLREQLRLREALLLDLGALVYELHRQGKRAPELLQQKAAELTVVDEEVRELQAALDGREEPARETTEVEAVAGDELEEEYGEEDALGEEPPEGVVLDEEDLEEDDPRAEDETGEADEIAPDEDDQPTLAEQEEPRA
jgi:hypothetical protein